LKKTYCDGCGKKIPDSEFVSEIKYADFHGLGTVMEHKELCRKCLFQIIEMFDWDDI